MPYKVSPDYDNYTQHEKLTEIRKRRNVVVYERSPENYNNTTLFFYHGAGGTYKQFKSQISHLLRLGYRVVTCDMFAHGKSKCPARPENYMFTFEQYCYDALRLFDRYSVNNHNVLIGHSYGTSLCTLVYNERQSKVKKLILISGGGPFALAPEDFSLFSLPASLLSCFKPLILKVFKEVCFHSPVKKSSVPNSELLSIEIGNLQQVMRGQKWDEGDEAYHALINCPVLLLVGRHDKFIPLADEMTMNLVISQSVLHVLEGGHMLPIDCSDEVNDIITSFLINDLDVHSKLHENTIFKKPQEEVT